MYRNITLSALVLLSAALHAQDDSRPPKSTPDQERSRPVDQRQPSMAGSPRAQWDSIGQPHVPDTAFASILLDRSQADRIEEMDRRYTEAFRTLGTADPKDPRYQRLWDQRRREVENILTPTQYARWKELNAAMLLPPEPVDMPMVTPSGDVTPMPILPMDSTDLPMPILDDVAPSPPPQQQPR